MAYADPSLDGHFDILNVYRPSDRRRVYDKSDLVMVLLDQFTSQRSYYRYSVPHGRMLCYSLISQVSECYSDQLFA